MRDMQENCVNILLDLGIAEEEIQLKDVRRMDVIFEKMFKKLNEKQEDMQTEINDQADEIKDMLLQSKDMKLKMKQTISDNDLKVSSLEQSGKMSDGQL